MTLKDMVLNMQLSALEDADFNGLHGPGVAKSLRTHKDLWSMLYFGGDDLAVFPSPGKDEDLAKLFQFDREDESSNHEIFADEISWEEVEGKRYISAWWD